MSLKIAICDDEAYFREHIFHVVKDNLMKQNITEYKIDVYSSGEALCKNTAQILKYDVLFLDISMPNRNGMQVAEYIRSIHPWILLIFITSYIDFAPAGYELNALRYILKDHMEEYMPEAIRAILRKLELQNKRITYDFQEGKETISLFDLYYIESQKHKLVFHVEKLGIRTLYGKLDDMDQQLRTYNFIRIHKSFLVNYKHIKKIESYKLLLDIGEELPIPRERFRQVKEQYYELRGGLQ